MNEFSFFLFIFFFSIKNQTKCWISNEIDKPNLEERLIDFVFLIINFRSNFIDSELCAYLIVNNSFSVCIKAEYQNPCAQFQF